MNTKLPSLIERFLVLENTGFLNAMRKRKWGGISKAATLLQSDRLRSLNTYEATQLYQSLPISQRKLSKFLSNPLADLQECLWFLLYEEAPYEIRVWEFLDDLGGYRLIGSDQTLVGALFCIHDPTMFGLVGAKATKALKNLGVLPIFKPKESHAGRFQKLQEALWEICKIGNLQNFMIADDFLETLALGMLEGNETSAKL